MNQFKVLKNTISFFLSSIFRFNQLFSFLLKVRRTQIELQSLWAYLMSAKRSGKKKMASGPVWVLRRRMAFFIDNLQYYLQVSLIFVRPVIVDVAFSKQVVRYNIWSKHNPYYPGACHRKATFKFKKEKSLNCSTRFSF